MKPHAAKLAVFSLVAILTTLNAYAVDRCGTNFSPKSAEAAKSVESVQQKSLAEANNLDKYVDLGGNRNPLLDVLVSGIPESSAFERLGVLIRGRFAPKLDRTEIDKDHGDRRVFKPSGKPKIYDGVAYVEFPNSTSMTTTNPRDGSRREFIITRGVREYEAGIRLEKKGENSPSGYVSDVLLFEKVGNQIVYRHRLLDSAPELRFFFEDPRISVLYDTSGNPHYYLSGTDYSPHVAGSKNPDVMNRFVELNIDHRGLPTRVEVDSRSKKPEFENLSPEPRQTEDGIVFVDAKNATIAQNDLGQVVVRTRLRPDFNNAYVQRLAGSERWNYAEQVFTFENFEAFKSYNWNDALIDVFKKTDSEALSSQVRPLIAKTIITEKDLKEHLTKFNTGNAKLATYKAKGLGPGTRPIRIERKGNEIFVSEDARAPKYSAGVLTTEMAKRLKIEEGEPIYITFDHEIRYFEQVVNGKTLLRRHYSASIKVFDKSLSNMIDYLPDVIQAVRTEERGLDSGILDLQHVYPMGYVIDTSGKKAVVRVYAGASDAHTTAYNFDVVKLLTESR